MIPSLWAESEVSAPSAAEKNAANAAGFAQAVPAVEAAAKRVSVVPEVEIPEKRMAEAPVAAIPAKRAEKAAAEMPAGNGVGIPAEAPAKRAKEASVEGIATKRAAEIPVAEAPIRRAAGAPVGEAAVVSKVKASTKRAAEIPVVEAPIRQAAAIPEVEAPVRRNVENPVRHAAAASAAMQHGDSSEAKKTAQPRKRKLSHAEIRRRRKRERRMRMLRRLLIFVCLAVFLASCALLVQHYVQQNRLAKENTYESQPGQMISKYLSSYQSNPDLFGWVKVEYTAINQAVMHTPQDESYYLNRSFGGQESQQGLPYLLARCSLQSTNQVIFGATQKNGTGFSTLWNYESTSYCLEHLTIEFDSMYEERRYQVFAVLTGDEQFMESNVFAPLDLPTQDEYNAFIANIRAKANYYLDMPVPVHAPLVTLCTRTEDGRYIAVVAVKK